MLGRIAQLDVCTERIRYECVIETQKQLVLLRRRSLAMANARVCWLCVYCACLTGRGDLPVDGALTRRTREHRCVHADLFPGAGVAWQRYTFLSAPWSLALDWRYAIQ